MIRTSGVCRMHGADRIAAQSGNCRAEGPEEESNWIDGRCRERCFNVAGSAGVPGCLLSCDGNVQWSCGCIWAFSVAQVTKQKSW